MPASIAQMQCVEQHRGEQYLELPCAICTPSGAPHKGQKSFTTKFLEKRYSNVVVSMFPKCILCVLHDSPCRSTACTLVLVPLLLHTNPDSMDKKVRVKLTGDGTKIRNTFMWSILDSHC